MKACLVACPEGGIVGKTVIVEAAHLLGDLEILIDRVGIDTLLSREIDDVAAGGVRQGITAVIFIYRLIYFADFFFFTAESDIFLPSKHVIMGKIITKSGKHQ